MKISEKIFISWVGPRGIVAAGIASLFGLTLTIRGVAFAEYITPLVFMVVLGTVLLNATTARLLAKLLRVTLKASNGILIIGAGTAARLIAKYLKQNGRHVVLIDSSVSNIKKAKEQDLEAFVSNIFSDDLSSHFELLDIGYLMALTSSADVNRFACERFKSDFGEKGTFRLITEGEMKGPIEDIPEGGLFSTRDDYINISEVARDFPFIHEIPINTSSDLTAAIQKITEQANSVPIFLKENDGNLEIIPANPGDLKVENGNSLVYMGEKA
jgi:NhaP-type Na+/H+ or K+/H+ antiporter